MYHCGCSKNLIDTEVAIGQFKKHKYEIINNPQDADIIVINTCGFIESAKEEAINTILEMAEYKKQKCKYLVVMGCLVQRYYTDLIKELPEVDLFIKLDDYDNFWKKISDLVEKGKVEISDHIDNIKISEVKKLPLPKMNEFYERVLTTGENYAYLKIGEGCSNNCTYCAIPYIRGPFISRPIEEIIKEAEILADKGIKELIIIAQDTTKYGVDLYGDSKLAELLERLSKIEKIEWIRFLYSYPEGITDELIATVRNNSKICKYFDIPIQHISNEVLKRMNRQTTREHIEGLLEKIRKEIPDVTLRTSLIVGFPGETEEQFKELYDFVKTAKFDKLGAFEYSKEEGTPAAKLPEQIHHATKRARYNKIMELQRDISNELMKRRVGRIENVLIEDKYIKDKRYVIGRTSHDAPDIDGVIYVKKDSIVDENTIINSFVECKIIDYLEYDLFGKIIKPRIPLIWVGAVLGKSLFAGWDKKHNQIRFYMDEQNIAVYDLDVMNIIDDPIIFRNNTIANELSAKAKDLIQKIAKTVELEKLKNNEENYGIRARENLARVLGINRENLVSITEIDLDQEIERKKNTTKSKKEIIQEKKKQSTTKDIKIKQELKMSSMATSMKSIGSILQRAGKMPKVQGKKFTKIGIVESDRIKDIDKKAKRNTTRFSLVAIANDGTTVPLNLEQDHAEGSNPREISHRTNADGRVEQDDVNSRYRIGNSGETLSIKFSNGPGNIEVGYSARKTIGGDGVEGNVSYDHQLETSTVYWRPRVDSRDQEYSDGSYGAEERAQEAKLESKHITNLQRGKKGLVDSKDNLEYKNVDGKKTTKDMDHENDFIERARRLMSEDSDVANAFTEKEVVKRLENAHDEGEDLSKVEENIKDDADRLPTRNR